MVLPLVVAVAVRSPRYCEEKTQILPAVAGAMACEKGTTTGAVRGAATALRAGLNAIPTTAMPWAWAIKLLNKETKFRQPMNRVEKCFM